MNLPCFQFRRRAFTLIELLAVIIIIGILLAAASTLTIPRPTPLQSAEITAAALEQVRIDAIATGRPTALLILSDPDDDRPQKLQPVRRSGSDESAPWEIIGPSTDLGSGILFKNSDSTSDADGSAVAKMTLPLRGGAEGEGPEWFTFGFAADGTPLQPGARLVFARGSDEGFASPEEDAALIISDNGRSTPAFDFASFPK